MLKVESPNVKFGKLTKFFDELDQLWEREELPVDIVFKDTIQHLLENECFILQPNVKASLYHCDYGYGEKEIILICGSESFVGNTKIDLGHIALKKRILKNLGYKVRVIDKMTFTMKKKLQEKIDYIKKELQGIPVDKARWIKKQKEKGIFHEAE